MTAPNLETLLNVEAEIESVLQGYLVANLALPVIISDSETIEQTPRVEVVAIVTEQGPHQNFIETGTYAGRRFYDFFRVSISIDAVYSPSFPQSPGVIRGKIRSALTDYSGIQAAFDINGYLLLASDSFRQSGGGRSVDAEREEARTSSVLQCVFQINPGAIPA